MKSRLLLGLLMTLFVFGANAQNAPQKFNYQAVARNADGESLAGKQVNLRIGIFSAENMDRPVYSEEHAVTTNKLGLFNIHIGAGEAFEGSMENIDWGVSAHYIQVMMDADNSGKYEEMGTSQLLSVPYALYAAKSGSSEDGGFNPRNDPNDWTINGNTGTNDANNFIGTNDAQDLAVRTNNTEVVRFEVGGNVGIGTTTPVSKLDVSGDVNLSDGSFLREDGSIVLGFPGTSNVHLGRNAGSGSTGSFNVLIGEEAGENITTGSFNMLLGYKAGNSLSSGIQNVMLGYGAGGNTTNGDGNMYLGQFAGASGSQRERIHRYQSRLREHYWYS